MARELWLLRHGKAERYDGVEDYDRTLKKRGRRAAKAIGRWLKKHDFLPDHVISSPATRAIATAKIICNELDINSDCITQDKRIYDEGLVRIKSVLAECDQSYNRILLVGHNPELEDLLRYLVDPTQLPDPQKLLPTAACARLVLPDDWTQLERNCAELLEIVYPNSLLEEEIKG